MHVRTLLCTLALGTAMSPAMAQIDPYFDDLIIFSGSLSDTGNLATITGDLPPPFWENRNSNGPVAADVFAEALGYDAEPSLHLIGEVGGNNFAVTGSRTRGNDFTDMPAQLDAYFARTGGVADPDVLYLVFIGGHDVIEAILEPDPQLGDQIIRDAVVGLRENLDRLIAAGAEHIYAPGFIDIGYAPAIIEAGLVDYAGELSALYEVLFLNMLKELEAESDIRFYRFNFYEFVNQYIEFAPVAGFSNVDEACTEHPSCDFEKFIFMNETFPTARVHRMLGNAMASALLHQIASCRPGAWNPSSCR